MKRKCDKHEHYHSRKEVVTKHKHSYEFSGKWRPSHNPYISIMEQELAFYCSMLGEQFITNSINVINPYEVDVYFPRKNIALEFNGDYWHSDEYMLKSKKITAEDYHYHKLTLCDNTNVKLGFVWENEWRYNKITVMYAVCDFLQFSKNLPLLSKLDNKFSPSNYFWDSMDWDTKVSQRLRLEKKLSKKLSNVVKS